MIENGTKVVVTTEYRGVFFGTQAANDREQRTMVLTNARNCVYWPAAVHGFLGLATSGPVVGSKVGPACCELELSGVTSVSRCTPEAIAEWEAGPWS